MTNKGIFNQQLKRHLELVTRLPIMAHVIDKDGHLLNISDLWLKKLGYEREEVIGKHATIFLTEKSKKYAVEIALPECCAKGFIENVEYEFLRKDNTIINVLLSANLINDENDELLGYLATSVDITEKKRKDQIQRIQLKLVGYASTHTSKELLRAFLDELEKLTGSNIGFFHLYDEKSQKFSLQTWSSNTLSNMCKLEVPTTHYQIDKAGVWADCARKRKPVIHNDYQSLSHKKGLPAGHATIIRELVVPVIRGDEVVAVLGVGNKKSLYNQIDVETVQELADLAWETLSRKLTEEKLRDSTIGLQEALLKYSTLFHSFPYGITVSDSSGAIVETNEVAKKLLGVGKDDHEARKIHGKEWRIIRPDGSEMPQDEWPGVIALKENRTITGVEMGVVKPNGEIGWLAVAATPLLIDNYGFVTTYNDITQAYLERQKLNKLVCDQSAILNNIQSLIFFKDTENNIIHISQSVADITGLPKHEIEGKHSRDIYPEMADQYWKDDLEVIKSKQPKIGIVEPLFDSEGNTRWLLTDKVPYIDSDGIVSGVIVMASDITDRVTFEKQLITSEAKLKAIFRNNPAGIVITTLQDSVIIDCNESLENITGYTKSELVGKKTVETNFWPRGLTQREEVASLLRTDGSFRNLKIEFITKQNEKRQGLFSAEVIRLEDQDHIITTMFDLTDLQRVEQALLESKQKYQSMVENIGIGVALINQDMEIVELNKQMREWFPAVDTALKPLCFQVLNHPPKDAVCDWCPTYKTLQDGKIHETISETPDRDGVRNFRIVSSPIVNSKGEVTAAIELAEDITDQLKYEEQLRKAQRMESIGDLAGGIAHDFNNILSPIIGYSEMLIDELPQQSRELDDARCILEAGKRGSALVKQILSFSRQSDQQFVPTRIQHILKEVFKLSRSTIPAYIRMRTDIQPNCGLILGDPTQLHQVAMNLIVNAYHAVEDKGGEVTVKLNQAVLDEEKAKEINIGPGSYAVFQVSDTGHGVPKELVGKIFDPYFTTKEQGKGTGLGLSVVHGIVKGHGGAIKVDSEIGKGTTFDVYLPLMEERIVSPNIKDPRTIQSGIERILLVDDEKAIVMLELRMLERLGYQVTFRVSSVEALELFRAKPYSFDLVVSDMAMPNMPGDLFAEELRAIRPDIPIIICTGFSERIREDNMQKMGINGLLMKPVLKSDLAEIVRKVLDEAK